jgi:hypothetical protein
MSSTSTLSILPRRSTRYDNESTLSQLKFPDITLRTVAERQDKEVSAAPQLLPEVF